MLAVAVKAVQRAKELGWEILVGDASGIDSQVIETCDETGVPVTVYGAYNTLRVHSIQGKYVLVFGSYTDRDVKMAEECDKCYAIWNGESRGTKLTYKVASELHKECWLFTDK
jgi:hypothetical protein